MNVIERDLLICRIVRGEVAVPIEALEADLLSEPDLLAIKFIDLIADEGVSDGLLQNLRLVVLINPEHRLLHLIALAAITIWNDPSFRSQWIATLASDDMLAEVLAKQAVAA